MRKYSLSICSIIILIFCAVCTPGFSLDSPAGISFSAVPGADTPLVSYFSPGPSILINGRADLENLPFFAEISACYSSNSSRDMETASKLHTIGLTAGAGLACSPAPFLDLSAGGRIGYGNGILANPDSTKNMGSLIWGASAEAAIAVTEHFSLLLQTGLAANTVTHFSINTGIGLKYAIKPAGLVISDEESILRDQEGFSTAVLAGADVPLVPYFNPGPSVHLDCRYDFERLPFYADARLLYSSAGSRNISTEAELYTPGLLVGGGLAFSPFPLLNLSAGGRIGYGHGILSTPENDTNDMGGLLWGATAAAEVPLNRHLMFLIEGNLNAHLVTHFSAEANLGMRYSFSSLEPSSARLFQKQAAKITAEPVKETFGQPADTGPADLPPLNEVVSYDRAVLVLTEAGFSTVFPVFYRYYNNNPIGRARFSNNGKRDIQDIEITVHIPKFMDIPQSLLVCTTLPPGNEISADLSVLFNDALLAVTEGTKVAAELTVSYAEKGKPQSYSVATFLNVANRNAMTWDDDRKAASFVTAKDPEILTFAKIAAGAVRSGGHDVLNSNFRNAMGLFEALNLYGLKYVIDPATPHSELSENSAAIDFLQFPVQTLRYRAGDCDDLSICYAACLESIGIASAFITVPGHIYTAFNTGLDEHELNKHFDRTKDIIIHEGKGWIPVEITMLEYGFFEAWKTGAREWREHNVNGNAAILPVREAWKAFEPIGFDLGERSEIEIPETRDILEAYSLMLEKYIMLSVEKQTGELREKIETNGPTAKLCNRMGLVYAKHELHEPAKKWLQQSVDIKPNSPAFLNLGHLLFIERDYKAALEYYGMAEELSPDSAPVLLALSRTSYELEAFDSCRDYFNALKSGSPSTAEKYAYLDTYAETGRRASSGLSRNTDILWGEFEE